MTHKRIHELAKEWGVSAQAVLTQLEKLVLLGRKYEAR
jgi:Zn-dependent peptidase ImmA (M78 family)